MRSSERLRGIPLTSRCIPSEETVLQAYDLGKKNHPSHCSSSLREGYVGIFWNDSFLEATDELRLAVVELATGAVVEDIVVDRFECTLRYLELTSAWGGFIAAWQVRRLEPNAQSK